MCEKTNLFIEKAIQIHGNKYSYDKVTYKTNVTKVDVFCNTHQKYFSITPQLHLFGGGCPDCNNGFFTKNHITIEECQKRINKHSDKLLAIDLFCESGKIIIKLKCCNHSEFLSNYIPNGKYTCSECYKESHSCDTESFINKSRKIHGDKYDYSEVNYIRNSAKVKIKCLDHDEIFYQKPMKHLCGTACSKCITHKLKYAKRLTNEQFIEKAKNIHGDKYDYSEVEYEKNSINVKIFCKTHSEFFWQTPMRHLRGSGCSKCGRLSTTNSNKITLEKFIEVSKQIHDDKYDYSNTIYGENSESKVNITCPVHGEFFQQARGHMDGKGCSKCNTASFSKGEQKIDTLLTKNNIKFQRQYSCDDCKYVYKLKFDFCIFVGDLIGLIEYNGEQHYKKVDIFHKKDDSLHKQQVRDKIKEDYCQTNNIPFLIIKYTQFKTIEKRINNFINSLKERPDV